MDWLGWAEVIGGGVLTAFGGGAVGVPLIAAGAGHIAANKAVDQQTQSAQKAQGQLTQQYQQTRSDLGDIYKGQQAQSAPYLSLGAGAASLLGQGLGIPNIAPYPGANLGVSGAKLGPSAGGLVPGTLMPPQTPTSTAPLDRRIPPGVSPSGTAVPRDSLGSLLLPSMQRQSSYTGQGLVTMQAPNGETAQVPMAQVPFFKSRGAQVVS